MRVLFSYFVVAVGFFLRFLPPVDRVVGSVSFVCVRVFVCGGVADVLVIE